ncbi:MAG TPA: SLOG family protein, partial [Bacillaceae bacterium]
MPKIVAVSGYKPFELGIFSDNHPGLPYIKKALADRLATLAEEGTEWIIITGQLGVELWAAETVLDLQTEYPS